MFWRCFCSFPKDCLEHAVANLHKKSQLISMLNKKCLCIEICMTRYWLINQIDSNDCEIAVSND